jgi:uncharacterized membrane protein
MDAPRRAFYVAAAIAAFVNVFVVVLDLLRHIWAGAAVQLLALVLIALLWAAVDLAYAHWHKVEELLAARTRNAKADADIAESLLEQLRNFQLKNPAADLSEFRRH